MTPTQLDLKVKKELNAEQQHSFKMHSEMVTYVMTQMYNAMESKRKSLDIQYYKQLKRDEEE